MSPIHVRGGADDLYRSSANEPLRFGRQPFTLCYLKSWAKH